MLQLRKAKKRRRGCAQRQLDGAETFFDLLHGLLLAHFLAVQVRMRPGMGADAMAGRRHLFENFGMVGRVLADREEHRLGAFIRERFEHGGRVYRPGTVVEGQHDFLVRQEVELLEMLVGPPVVSISTTRLTPSASGLAHAAFGCGGTGGSAGLVAVTSKCLGIWLGLPTAG